MQKILLHICCGACCAHPASLLSQTYEVIGFFYNSNIWPYEEWLKRYEAFREFAEKHSAIADYFPKQAYSAEEYIAEHRKYLSLVAGYESEPEGGARCPLCFKFRLEEVARIARELDIDEFATTLTIGRNKRPEIINPLGVLVGEKYGVKFYEANFKRQDGAIKGRDIYNKYNLYRQHYCGCEFSLRDRKI